MEAADFMPLEGDWKGTLTYLDYTSQQLTSIPASARMQFTAPDGLDLFIFYAEEPGKNDRTYYRIGQQGTRLNGMTLVEKRDSAGIRILVMDEEGRDGNDNRRATLRRIWQLSSHHFTIIKEIRWKGETGFFERHRYVFAH
jgi:hypothetical protein